MKRPRLKDYPPGNSDGYLNLDGSIKYSKYVLVLNKYIDFQEDKKKRKRRSLKANALYWLWLKCLEDETGQSKDDFHDLFKDQFIGIYTREVFGKKVIKEPSTSTLDDKAFSYYMKQVQAESITEFNTRVPLPEDQGFEQFMDKYENFIK